MCLVYILIGIGSVLTMISGQYSDHVRLFWSFIGSTIALGLCYSIQRQIMARDTFIDRNPPLVKLMFELAVGIFGVAAIVQFIWLCVVIWI
jgi:hypothetical protein